MIRIILILAVLLASTYLGVQLSQDPGYVLVSFKQWTLETTLLFSLFALLLSFFLFSLFISLLRGIFHLPDSWRAWRIRRRKRKARETTRKGLIEYSEGYWKKANKHLIKALPDTDMPLLNYLTAARASQNFGDSKLRDKYLREAQQSMPEARIAIELTQAELQIANQQWEQALATLKHLQDLAPGHPYVIKLLMKLYQKVDEWPQLLALLPDLKKNHILSDKEYQQTELHAYLKSIETRIKYNDKNALDKLMQSLPRSLSCSPVLYAPYAAYLIEQKAFEEAEAKLRQCLKKSLDEPLIRLYGLCLHNPAQQLAFAESLVKKAPQSAMLYLSLGRLCKYNQLWGKARTYLEKSIHLQSLSENHFELGQLYEQLNEAHKACEQFKKAAILSIK